MKGRKQTMQQSTVGDNIIKQYSVVSSTMVCGVTRKRLVMLWGEIWLFEGGYAEGARHMQMHQHLTIINLGWKVTMEVGLGGKNAI